MEDEQLKEGDVVVIKSNPKDKYTIIEINSDTKSAFCLNKDREEVELPLVSLRKPGFSGFAEGIYD